MLGSRFDSGRSEFAELLEPLLLSLPLVSVFLPDDLTMLEVVAGGGGVVKSAFFGRAISLGPVFYL